MTEIDTFVKASNVKPKTVRWMWEDMIQLNTLALIAGEAGLGKTTLAANIAAIVTQGGDWPDGSISEKRSVLIINTEDEFSEAILPKLIAAGANTDKVYSYDGKTNISNNNETLSIADHLTQLTIEIKKYPDLGLIIFDPITSVLHDQDQNKHAAIRKLLEELIRLCTSHEITIIGITHLSKNDQTTASNRIIGSVAFRNVPRTVLLLQASNDSFKLSLDKGNNAKKRLTLHYTIEPYSFNTENNETIETSKIEWQGANTTNPIKEDHSSHKENFNPSMKAKYLIMGMCLENREGFVRRSEILDRLDHFDDISTSSIDRALKDTETFEKPKQGLYKLKGFDTAWVADAFENVNFNVNK